jgi:hypothetical protein
MVVGVDPHCFGVRLENGRFSDLTYCKKSRDNSYDEGEPTDCAVKTKELCRS